MVIEPLEMTQEFRRFEYSTPWESFPNFRPKDETEAEAPIPQVESGEKKWLDDKINFITNTMLLHVNKTILTIMLVLLFPMPGQARLSFCRIIWIRWILFASPRVFYWMIRIFYWPVWSFNSVSLLFLLWEFFCFFFLDFLITYCQFC